MDGMSDPRHASVQTHMPSCGNPEIRNGARAAAACRRNWQKYCCRRRTVLQQGADVLAVFRVPSGSCCCFRKMILIVAQAR